MEYSFSALIDENIKLPSGLVIMKRLFNLTFGLFLSALLIGCGGGGGGGSGGGPVTSTLTFPLATANANLINNGYTLNLAVTGTQIYNGKSYGVTGSVTLAQSASTPSTFEGQPALLNTQSMNGTVTVLSATLPVTSSAQVYSTTNYAPLGQVASGSYYVMQGTPTIPSTGKVGDTAVIGTFNVYTDSTKLNLLGTAKISYVVEADTASTAIIALIEDDYDTSNTLNASTQTRWKMDASGNVTFVSVRLTGTTPVGPFNYLFQ
jgi:hypothetical protein